MKRLSFIFFIVSVITLTTNAQARTTINVNESGSFESLADQMVSISGKCDVHVLSSEGLKGADIQLWGADAWLYLDEIKPSMVISTYLPNISVDGEKADMAKNVRLAQYRGGCVVIPHGYDSYSKALTVYSRPNCAGDFRDVAIETYHTDLADFDNNIRSFVLKKGFQACLANNPDGSGYSRVYIADTEDLVINELPEGFVTKDGTDRSFISFIRVCKHQWVSKKGWAGWNANVLSLTNSTHNISWSAETPAEENMRDCEFVPMRSNYGWPSFTTIYAQKNVSHLLSHNEPGDPHATQEMRATIPMIISEWKDHMKSGLRLGSPSSQDETGKYLSDFFNCIDSLNYRCDIANYHHYVPGSDFNTPINTIVAASNGRPVWITEWNNGAQWTNEAWPDMEGPKCDVDEKEVFYRDVKNEIGFTTREVCSQGDEGAYTVTVSRPLTPANAEKQLEYVKQSLECLDNIDKVERHNFYNAAGDARQLVMDDRLTRAGRYFAEYNSKVGYSKKSEYEHEWKIAPPFPAVEQPKDDVVCRLSWYDHNGETGKSYTIFRRDSKSDSFKEIAVLELNKDYNPGETILFDDPVVTSEERQYCIQATSYKDEKSIMSRIVSIAANKVDIVEECKEESFRISAGGGILKIISDKALIVAVYNEIGIKVRDLEVREGNNRFDGFDSGIYIVAGQKIAM